MSLVTLWRCLPRGWTNGLRHGAAGTTSTAGEERYKVVFKPRWWTGQV